jgi:hypothetical protein
MPVDLIDSYTTEIQIKSNKGGKLKESAITEMLNGIGDSLAKNLIPNIDELANVGERAFQTLTRLNTEFSALGSAAMNLGASADYARELVEGMSFGARSALIDLSGGMEQLASKTAFFAANFLTESERMAPVVKSVGESLATLGLSANLTKDQFKELVQSSATSAEMRNTLLNLAPDFLAVLATKSIEPTITPSATITSEPNYFSNKISADSGSQSEDYTGFATRAEFTRSQARTADLLRRQKAEKEGRQRELDILNGISDGIKNSNMYARKTTELLIRVTRDGNSLVTSTA